jgi:hypothetical protein
MNKKSFLAFDLGATIGRTILGTIEQGCVQIKEFTRFSNQVFQIGGHINWNIYSLYEHLKAGLINAKREGVAITSIGSVDSLQEMHQIIYNSAQLDEFTSEDSIVWTSTYQKFLGIIRYSNKRIQMLFRKREIITQII